jgi:hypothetical protein
VSAEALKKLSSDAVMRTLFGGECPLVVEWISSTDLNPATVKRAKQIQLLIDAARGPYVEAAERRRLHHDEAMRSLQQSSDRIADQRDAALRELEELKKKGSEPCP